MNEKLKNQSPLVKSVLNLDTHFSDLERLSSRIQEMDLKTDFDMNQARQLMARFSESATAVSTEIVELAARLEEARMRAEENGRIVALKAEELQSKQSTQEDKMVAFQKLTAKVAELNEELKMLRKPEGEEYSPEEKEVVNGRMAKLRHQLQPLIDEANVLKDEARVGRMKVLEQNADSLSQSLSAISQKLAMLQPEMAH
ncbi:MAG: hypothetical protein K0R29_2550 [Pseudobdellovibrio sp.]|jgi:chromosome segregation ATPase|nr:hypothetical protein [Pseudobdellovibrio sp.]